MADPLKPKDEEQEMLDMMAQGPTFIGRKSVEEMRKKRKAELDKMMKDLAQKKE